ncbi:LuxR C-terminal-related transcriptional regulator [Acinetobacter ursingii]|uniref:PA1136 family autoinducer-binding transcriptional regulator n=1 Tax=Acinetobacter ursingii TaxID=108980 RepID=UPI00244B52A7|nr:PA1136 family autoinducer-binding transcriptional regulator [Acinetobacter ursingii]MDH2018894.1 LuxR C-terminal-related transcriptional regulator [Acinetobacter ursingii]MDH2071133.1 LuxR C-terminal-related transcriptional regulator [Acinetobacter ursingii]
MMSESVLSQVADVVLAIQHSTDMNELSQHVRAFAKPLGYDRFIIYTVPSKGEGVIGQLLWLEGDWFGDNSEVTPETYLARCPVNRHLLETDQAFFWTKQIHSDQEVYRVVAHPKGLGIHGLQVPIFAHAGLLGAMSFGGCQIESSLDVQLAFSLIARIAFQSAQRINHLLKSSTTSTLSARELEVIRWIASGRRQADVAVMLGLSTRTIENHLRRIRERLGATSTAQAIHLLIRDHQLKL